MRSSIPRPPRGPFPRLAGAALGALLALAAACSEAPPRTAAAEAPAEGPALVGTWEGSFRDGTSMRMRFDAAGGMTWQIVAPSEGELFTLRYALDRSHEPHWLDVRGFERGPLVGLTLRGIVSFEGPDAFRWDAEPGDPAARPAGFGPETWTYHRVR